MKAVESCLSEEQVKALTTWDLSHVRSFLVRREGMDEARAVTLEENYRVWLVASLENTGRILPASRAVDEFWHTHILFTRDYRDFCKAIAGKFLHHKPLLTDEEIEGALVHYETNTLPLLAAKMEIDTGVWGAGEQICWSEPESFDD